jgi:hypothetical protein
MKEDFGLTPGALSGVSCIISLFSGAGAFPVERIFIFIIPGREFL